MSFHFSRCSKLELCPKKLGTISCFKIFNIYINCQKPRHIVPLFLFSGPTKKLTGYKSKKLEGLLALSLIIRAAANAMLSSQLWFILLQL